MNLWIFNTGLIFILLGGLLFVYYTRMTRQPERDLEAQLREKDTQEADGPG